MTPIRLLVIDDHTLMRRGLIALVGAEPGFVVAGEAADAHEGIKQAAQLQPDVVLLDLHMPGISGLQALPNLREACPRSRILMLTVSEEADDLVGALRAGADGYLLKTIESHTLIASIHRALRGEAVISEHMTGKLVSELRNKESGPQSPLSPREHEIMLLIAEGASNKEIARRLGVAESTVKIHVQHILRKLDLTSRVQIAVYASEQGFSGR